MLIEFFPVPFWVSAGALAMSLVWMRMRKHSWARLFAFATTWFYLMAVICLTLFPVPISHSGEWRRQVVDTLARVNLIPFDFGGLFTLHPNIAIRELGGNVLLSVPFGLGLPFWMQFKARRFIWLALLPGLAVEIAQLCLSMIIGSAYRGVDINDLLLNTAGAWLGYGLFHLLACSFQATARCGRLRPGRLRTFLENNPGPK